ncbi:MAG: hypothetical protein ACE5FN_11200 [Leptospirillia bacterium]
MRHFFYISISLVAAAVATGCATSGALPKMEQPAVRTPRQATEMSASAPKPDSVSTPAPARPADFPAAGNTVTEEGLAPGWEEWSGDDSGAQVDGDAFNADLRTLISTRGTQAENLERARALAASPVAGVDAADGIDEMEARRVMTELSRRFFQAGVPFIRLEATDTEWVATPVLFQRAGSQVVQSNFAPIRINRRNGSVRWDLSAYYGLEEGDEKSP